MLKTNGAQTVVDFHSNICKFAISFMYKPYTVYAHDNGIHGLLIMVI